MKRFLIAVGILVGACIVVPVLSWLSTDLADVRYRMTVTVTVDDQPISGSGLREEYRYRYAEWTTVLLIMPGLHLSNYGEAFAVDLKERGKLFVLMRNAMGDNRSHDLGTLWQDHGVSNLMEEFGKSYTESDYFRWVQNLKGKITLKSSELPMLVHFRDIHDPTSVEILSSDDLAAAFGPGVKFVEATMEITNDPVTTGIESELPWLKSFSPQQVINAHRSCDLNITNVNPVTTCLGKNDFIKVK